MRRGIAIVLALMASSSATAFAGVPENAEYSEAYFESGDGTRLHADVLRPKGADRAPVVLDVSPYNAHGDPVVAGSNPAAEPPPEFWLAKRIKAIERGYTVVTVDLRGYGASRGCPDWGGSGEQADVKAAVEWAASQEWSTGRVALIGESYRGWTGVMGLATRPRGLAAVVTLKFLASAYDFNYANGVRHWHDADDGTALFNWLRHAPGALHDNANYHGQWLADEAEGCPVKERNPGPDRSLAYWRERDLVERATGSDVPVFADLGLLEVNVPPTHQIQFLNRLKRFEGFWLEQAIHEDPAREGLYEEELPRFLARHLKGVRPDVEDPRVTVQEAPSGRWRAERSWPPGDAKPFTLELRPGSYADAGSNASGDDYVHSLFTVPTRDWPAKGIGSWTFTQPLAGEAHLAGIPRLRVKVDGPPEARLIPLLYDVAPDGTAVLITRGATLLGGGRLEFDLNPQDWRIAARHRLGLLIAAADDSYYVGQGGTGGTVTVSSGSLSIPLLERERREFLEGPRGTTLDRVKGSIRVEQQTVDERATGQAPPRYEQGGPRSPRPRLTLRVRPARAPAGRRTRLLFRVTSGGTPVSRARVRFAGRRVRTNSRGKVTMARRISRSGTYRVTATKPGFRYARATIRVRRSRR